MGLIFNGNGDVIKAVDGSLTVEGLDIGGSTNIEAGIGTFSGNLNVGGVLTYEDVKNVDSVGIVTAREGVFIPDTKKLEIGNAAGSGDLKLHHTSGNSFIENGTGTLKLRGATIELSNPSAAQMLQANSTAAVNLYFNGNKKFETTNTGVSVTGHVFASSNVYSDKLVSTTQSNGHSMYINARNAVGTEATLIKGTIGGAVELNYNTYKKFETTNTGVSITGIPVATQSTGNVGLELHATGSGRGSQTKYHNDHGVQYVGTAGDTTGNLLIWQESNANMLFATNNTERLRIDSDGRLLQNGMTAIGDFMHQMEGAGGTGKVPAILFKNGTASTNEIIGGFTAYNTSNEVATIYAKEESANDDAYLQFSTKATGGSLTERLRIDSSGRLLLGAGSIALPKGSAAGSFDLDNGNITMCIGGNSNSTGRTNSTDKINRVTSPHYTNAEEPVAIYSSFNVSNQNIISYGGGSGQTNAVTKHSFYTATNTTTTTGIERLQIDSSGNLLLGTTTSIQKFTIDGGGISLDNGWNTQWGANASRAYIQGEDANGNNRLLLGTNNTERLRIDSAGHVMIGTTTEGFATYGDQFTIANSGHCGMTIRSGSSSDGNIYFSDGTSGADEVKGFVEYNHSSNYMNLGTNGGWKVRINSTGEVGIGVAAASGNLLHIKTSSADSKAKIESESGYDARLQLDTSSGGGAGAHIDFQMDGTTKGGIEYVNNASNAAVNSMIFRTGSNTERLRLTSGGQLVQFTTHTTGSSAHNNTSWYGDDANQYTIEIKDFNEMYAEKTVNTNSYDSIIYKAEKMTSYCDIEFRMQSAHDSSGSGYYHLGMVINGDGTDTHSNFDRLVFRSNGGNTSTNQIRLDKGGGGSAFSTATSNFPTFHDGTERHYQIKIRGRRFAIYINGAEVHVGYTDTNLVRSHGYFGFQIYEQSALNPYIRIREFKITNHTPSTGVPSWEVVFDTPAHSNASSSFVIDNMDNPQTVELRFWRLRHSGGNTNTYFRLGWQGSYQSSGYYDIAQYHNESGSFTASRGHNQNQGQPFHYDFTASTNYYSGVMTIRRVTSGGQNTGFVYHSDLVVDYDSGSTQYHIMNSGRVQFGNTNPWTKIQLYTNSGTNFNYGSFTALAQY